jgi:hypothetical protein
MKRRLEHLESIVSPAQRRAVEALHLAGLHELAARLGGAGAAVWVDALDSLFEGLAVEAVQRLADGADLEDVLAPEQLAGWELRSSELNALEAELSDPG